MPNRFCLYVVTSPSGKQYIGVTTRRLSERMGDHANDAIRSRGPARDRPLLRAYRKYGRDAMETRELVVSDDFDYLCVLECEAIKVFCTLVPDGYNATDGGQNSFRHTAETKEKISAASTALWKNNKIYRDKMCRQAKERMLDPEHKKRCTIRLRDPQVRRRQGISMRKRWTDPVYRDRLSKAIKAGKAKNA